MSWLGNVNYFSSDERHFTQVLVHKMHSSLTAELDLLTQMQSCPAEVIVKAWVGRKVVPVPSLPYVTCTSKARSKSLGAVPAGQA